jgi:gliding motility-associated-like protein
MEGFHQQCILFFDKYGNVKQSLVNDERDSTIFRQISINKAHDNKILATGTITLDPYGTPQNHPFVRLIDYEGNDYYSKYYYNPNYEFEFTSHSVNYDKENIFTSLIKTGFEKVNTIITKINEDGEVLKAVELSYYNQGIGITGAQKTTNNHFVLAGGTKVGTCLIMMDSSLAILWSRVYSNFILSPKDIKECENGDFIITGIMVDNGWDIGYFRTDKHGIPLVAMGIGGEKADEGYCIVEDLNHDVFIFSEPESFNNGLSQLGIIKLDAEGNIYWMRTYYNDSFSFPFGGKINEVGGVMAIATQANFNSNGKILILNTDKNGDAACESKFVSPIVKSYTVAVDSGITDAPFFVYSKAIAPIKIEYKVSDLVCEKNPCNTNNIKIPNILTLNNNNLNETWNFAIECEEFNDVRIYNRWGNQLFYSKESTISWDGIYKGQHISDGVYFYVIKLDNGYLKGTITVISEN